jgi:hypothetical protein
MRPDPAGALRPRFAWRNGADRPLVIHVLCDEPPCFRLEVGARARAEVVGDALRLAVSDGQVEAVEGPWIVELGVWWRLLGQAPIHATAELLATTSLSLFGKPLVLAAQSAALDPGGMTLDFVAHW